MKKHMLIIIATTLTLAICIMFFILNSRPDYSNTTLYVASEEDISSGSLADGAAKFSDKYGCTIEFTNDFSNCDLIYTANDDFSNVIPLDKFIKTRNKLYSRNLLKYYSKDNNIYAISNTLLGNLNYCIYRPDQFANITSPYDYYKSKKWTWDSFIQMSNDTNSNISVDWTNSYINMEHALLRGKHGETIFNYGTQEQVEWLNFVRTLIYDEGIINNTEGAFKVGFLPNLVLEAVNEDMRYIPWPTKSGRLGMTFLDERHFSIPTNAQNPKLSVKLANFMIKSCIETRTSLYESNMTPEDFDLLQKQLERVYTFPMHKPDEYVPPQSFIDDFIHGKTVTEHIFNVENNAVHIK